MLTLVFKTYQVACAPHGVRRQQHERMSHYRKIKVRRTFHTSNKPNDDEPTGIQLTATHFLLTGNQFPIRDRGQGDAGIMYLDRHGGHDEGHRHDSQDNYDGWFETLDCHLGLGRSGSSRWSAWHDCPQEMKERLGDAFVQATAIVQGDRRRSSVGKAGRGKQALCDCWNDPQQNRLHLTLAEGCSHTESVAKRNGYYFLRRRFVRMYSHLTRCFQTSKMIVFTTSTRDAQQSFPPKTSNVRYPLKPYIVPVVVPQREMYTAMHEDGWWNTFARDFVLVGYNPNVTR